MVTPSSIPCSATRGLDADLSSDEGSEEVLEDFEDKPIIKKKISDSNEDDGDGREIEAMGMCLLPLSGLFSFFFLFFFFGVTS